MFLEFFQGWALDLTGPEGLVLVSSSALVLIPPLFGHSRYETLFHQVTSVSLNLPWDGELVKLCNTSDSLSTELERDAQLSNGVMAASATSALVAVKWSSIG